MATNKNSLRRSHYVYWQALSLALSLPTKESDTPPTPPSVDFSHSLLVLLKIFASIWCDGAPVAKHGWWVAAQFFAQKLLFVFNKNNFNVKKETKQTSLVELI